MKKNLIIAIALSIGIYGTIKIVFKTTMKTSEILPTIRPETMGASSSTLNQIDVLVQQAINDQKLPGAVICIGYKGAVIYKKAFGSRMLKPKKRLMTTDTIFDVASLTKPIITATAILLLIEQNKISLNDPVSKFITNFAQHGKGDVTIQHLLTHRSGLPAVTNLQHYQNGAALLTKHLCELKLKNVPGTSYLYSDIGYIILGKIIEIVTNQSLKEFAKNVILKPLGLKNTYQNPHPILWPFIAPHEEEHETIIHGRVHDPRAHSMGGIAGHASLFSTAHDLAVFCQMLLKKGMHGGTRFLQERSVALLTQPLPDLPEHEKVGLGWDNDTQHSFPRGAHFSAHSFGHTGFTGVSIWIDPTKEMFVIFLSNQLHPAGKTQTKDLRYQISTIAAQSIKE